MNSMKRQKDRTLKDDLPRLVGAQYATGDEWRHNYRKNGRLQIGTYQGHCQGVNNKGICHLPLMEIEPCAAIAVELQLPLRELRVE